ncbi:sigma-E factor negative regulatory protein [Herbaspirillum sp.]|jgi:sigma-E factor negative regulatory protein RseA|uniref:sigma-E factor negative regulatory protein n=1 Tax=Herbaspirillum TaxID=963 RepID=UPI00258922BE|nr:sigma-E factor negative regulatory protein [Herbaspirillum sp.]MCP3654954.1 sigma-E factor negative regulatory protein [Herbaspirillum sp.]MCP3945867.1 sigma-E factor negative regulatory protein [Herbaspirillum sp.]MCP4032183.1 sigma-E factor negative regulatory protein [Herbaspirillum sp.]MCP4558386.1 sigma-E factor negative regulatory protein [Herbaspirillum sp.]
MDTKVTTKEQISALADGELSTEEMTLAFAALRSSKDAQDAWEDYHRIGEVLRSEEMDVSLSAGFSAKMSALLDAEPTIVAPQAAVAEPVKAAAAAPVVQAVAAANGDHRASRPGRLVRFLMPSAAAAAAAVAAVFVAMPQQAVVTADAKVAAPVAQVASAPVNVPSAIATVADTNGNPQNVNQLSSLAQQGEVKRDPRIDDYLFAHQRFSPSYSSAQYTRSAAFSSDADK